MRKRLLPFVSLALALGACSDTHENGPDTHTHDEAATTASPAPTSPKPQADDPHADHDHDSDANSDIVTTRGSGTVMSVLPDENFITLDHGPLPEIGMDAMRMPFDVSPDLDFADYEAGDVVAFELDAGESIGILITKMCRPAVDGDDCLGL